MVIGNEKTGKRIAPVQTIFIRGEGLIPRSLLRDPLLRRDDFVVKGIKPDHTIHSLQNQHTSLLAARLLIISLFIILGIGSRAFGEELWLSAGPEAGFFPGSFSSVSPADIGGTVDISLEGFLGTPLEGGLQINYAGYLPSSDWIKSMHGVMGLFHIGVRLPSGATFSLAPRACAGIQYLFAATAQDRASYSAGNYTARSAAQLLIQGGLEATIKPRENWGIGAGANYRLLVEDEGLHHGLAVKLTIKRKLLDFGKETPASVVDEAPGPAETFENNLKVLEENGNIRILRDGNIVTIVIENSFSPYEAEPTERTIIHVRRVAEFLHGVTAEKITVRGYVAQTGDEEEDMDQDLSLARAAAVGDILAVRGIAAVSGELVAEGLGIDNPVADNATSEGRARNRRVEILVEVSEEK